jgi:hypothetical protein
MSLDIGWARPARVLAWTFATAAGGAAAWVSYGFGVQLGGVPMGVVAAVNGAAMGALLASAVLDRLQRLRHG